MAAATAQFKQPGSRLDARCGEHPGDLISQTTLEVVDFQRIGFRHFVPNFGGRQDRGFHERLQWRDGPMRAGFGLREPRARFTSFPFLEARPRVGGAPLSVGTNRSRRIRVMRSAACPSP